jgi:hypothetical protein
MRLTLVLASGFAAGVFLHATALDAQQQRYASDTRIRISKEPLPAPQMVKGSTTRITVDGSNETVPPRWPARAFRIEDYANLTEGQLASFLALRDSLVIYLSRQAGTKAVDPNVRNYAATTERDRTNHLNKTLHEIVEEHIGLEAIQNDYAVQRLQELAVQFESMPSGPAFDAAFLRALYFENQNEVQVLTVNLKNAHDDDFEDLVEDSIKWFSASRDTAFAVIQTLGLSLP